MKRWRQVNFSGMITMKIIKKGCWEVRMLGWCFICCRNMSEWWFLRNMRMNPMTNSSWTRSSCSLKWWRMNYPKRKYSNVLKIVSNCYYISINLHFVIFWLRWWQLRGRLATKNIGILRENCTKRGDRNNKPSMNTHSYSLPNPIILKPSSAYPSSKWILPKPANILN